MDVVVPYTPLLGGIGESCIITYWCKRGLNAKPPKQIVTPNLPMITKEKMTIAGIETITPESGRMHMALRLRKLNSYFH